MRIGVITMVYNERHNLPIWLEHYGTQIGFDNLVVLDNGSDDGSTADLRGASRLFLPRGHAFDEKARMRLINDLANNLLAYYDAVIYTDCDEMLVADPAKYSTLTHYCEQNDQPVSTAIGLNVRHNVGVEPALVEDQKILQQRQLVQFVAPMCKPLIIRKPVSWGGGLHCCDYRPKFDDLYLFHLRYADMKRSLDRLATTRTINFARENAAVHQKQTDEAYIASNFKSLSKHRVIEDWNFAPFIEAFNQAVIRWPNGRYAVKRRVPGRGLNSHEMFRIPERFQTVF